VGKAGQPDLRHFLGRANNLAGERTSFTRNVETEDDNESE
jgi:hypothetical protein